MKVYAINGSPRKKGNTITLLQKALDGVKESIKDQEIETKIIMRLNVLLDMLLIYLDRSGNCL